MHKKLETDLMSLAHSILKMKNKDDIFALKERAQEIYEKLSLLAFVGEFVKETPVIKETKENLVKKIETAIETKNIYIEEEEKKEEKIIHNLEDEVFDSKPLEETEFVNGESYYIIY